MPLKLIREITPLTPGDCFSVFSRQKTHFDFPLHYHDEIELNFIQNARGAKRIVGDHIEEISDLELVLVGSNLQHGWFTHRCASKSILEITIQFHRDLMDERFLHRNQMVFLRNMLLKANRGILFSEDTIRSILPRLVALTAKSGFDSVLELLSILHDLSISRNMKLLADTSFEYQPSKNFSSRRVESVMHHLNKNFDKQVTLSEAAKLVAMNEVSFSRFFRKHTGQTFIETLTEIRVGHASRLLIETTQSINEIAYKCGFNNMSNFNRIFKKKKDCTPRRFREEYHTTGIRAFV